MKKLAVIISVFVGLLLVSGNSYSGRNMMKKVMEDTATYNWVYINEEAKVGTFSRFESKDKDYIMRYEMLSEKNGIYEMKVGFEKAPRMAGYLKGLEWHYMITADGFVKRAYLLDLKSGTEVEMRIAGEGEVGYLAPETIKLKKAETVETGVETFKVQEVVVYNLLVNLWFGKAEVTYVDFIAEGVPFGIVMKQETQSVKMPASEVLDFIGTINPMAAPNALMRFLLDKSGKASYKRTWTLIETGQK
jgi:hypothetical protein